MTGQLRKRIQESEDFGDTMTDYFHTSFYYSVDVGKWDKPHVKV